MTRELLGDVWQLETPSEEIATSEINWLYQQATKKRSTRARNILKRVFESNWHTIKERFETEGSVWYVWYMDGVRAFMELGRSGKL